MMRPRIQLLFTLVILSLLPSSLAAAQAWVSAKGELSLALRNDYQTAQGVWHGKFGLITGLPADSLNSAVSAEYVPIDHLAVGLTLNGDAARYTGPQSGANVAYAHGTHDDGSYHWETTDLDLEARYQVYDKAIALTPALHVRIPVTDYETRGYAAAGSHLRELGVGFHVGRYGLGLEDLVLQAGYSFTYVQKDTQGGVATSQYRMNRSDADLSLAYVITSKLIAGVGAAFRVTHDGFELDQYQELFALPDTDPQKKLIEFHDPVLKAKYFAPAVIASYQISRAWSVAGRFATIVWGNNVSNPISFGLTLGWANNLAE